MAALHKRALFRLMVGGSIVAFVPGLAEAQTRRAASAGRSIRPSRPKSSGRPPPTRRRPTRLRELPATTSSSPASAPRCASRWTSRGMRRAWSMPSPPRKWASSPTPTSPSRCSASPACRSTARTAKARSSPSAASARNITSSCSTAAKCRPHRSAAAAASRRIRARSISPISRRKASPRSKSINRAG